MTKQRREIGGRQWLPAVALMASWIGAATATALVLVNSGAAADTIEPGAVWPDDRGQHIQAHGGGISHLGNTYYWFGEDRGRSNKSRSTTSLATRPRISPIGDFAAKPFNSLTRNPSAAVGSSSGPRCSITRRRGNL